MREHPALSADEWAALLSDLERDEGFRPRPYECTEDVLTVGIGTALPFSKTERDYLSARRNLWPTKGMTLRGWSALPNSIFPLSREEAEWLLRHRAQVTVRGLRVRMLSEGVGWDSLHSPARVSLANMVYQLGVPRTMRFRRMVSALVVKDYGEAASEMLDSRWARVQTPARARRTANLMRSAERSAD